MTAQKNSKYQRFLIKHATVKVRLHVPFFVPFTGPFTPSIKVSAVATAITPAIQFSFETIE